MRGRSLKHALAALAASLLGVPALSQVQDGAGAPDLWVTLGTQAGPIANPERSQPANLLVSGATMIIVDIGDATVQQLAKVGVGVEDVDAVVISHLHFDHTGGLSAFLGLRYQLAVQEPVTVYGPPGTGELVCGIVDSLAPLSRIGAGLAHNRPPPSSSVRVVEVSADASFTIGDVDISTVENTHYTFVDYVGKSPELSLSIRFDTPQRSIVFTGDTGPSAAVEQLAEGADILIAEMLDIDAQLGVVQQSLGDAVSRERLDEIAIHLDRHHLSPASLGRMAERAGVDTLIVTHMGPGFSDVPSLLAYKAAIDEAFDGKTYFAIDLANY